MPVDEPILETVILPLNIFPPALASLLAPVLVVFTVPLKVQPFKYTSGEFVVKLPPITEPRAKFIYVLVPENAKLTAAFPNCVNVFKFKNPDVNPAPPTMIVLPTERVGVPVPEFQPK